MDRTAAGGLLWMEGGVASGSAWRLLSHARAVCAVVAIVVLFTTSWELALVAVGGSATITIFSVFAYEQFVRFQEQKLRELNAHTNKHLIALQRAVKQVQTILDTKQVISAGPFLYSIIQEGTPNSGYYCRPASLTSLAQFLLTCT